MNGQTQGTLGGQNDMLGVSGGTKEDEKREEGMRAAAVSHAGGLMLGWHRKCLALVEIPLPVEV